MASLSVRLIRGPFDDKGEVNRIVRASVDRGT